MSHIRIKNFTLRLIELLIGITVVSYAAAEEVVINKGCATPLTEKAPFVCVVDHKLWRGARPDDSMSKLLATGVRSIVNLEMILDDASSIRKVRLPQDMDYTLNYFRLPDWEPLVVLAPEKVDKVVEQFIAITRTQPTPIYVHCRSGRNRTGVVVAAYRVFNGMPIEQAIEEMRQYKGEWFESDAKYIRALTPEKRAAMEPTIATYMQTIKPNERYACTNQSCKKTSSSH